jgi:hypothetical protein
MSDHILIAQKIDEILWFDWDPIGVNDYTEARDEYRSYVPEIYDLKISGADREMIAERLYKIEAERIGLNGDRERCRVIADKIIELPGGIF